MGLLGKIGRVGAGVMTMGASEALGVGKMIDGSNKDGLNSYMQNADNARAANRQTQLNLLGQRQAPKLTPQQEARIKALEMESTIPLEQDPAYQSQIRQATSGGAAALSGIQNAQAASGAVGGFANQGSMADVYDRLGGELAQLNQGQQKYREAKRDTAADMRQGVADAQLAHENAMIDARMAIESGDAAAIQEAMGRAYAAKEQIDNQSRQFAMQLAQTGIGAYTGIQNANSQAKMANSYSDSLSGGQPTRFPPAYVMNRSR